MAIGNPNRSHRTHGALAPWANALLRHNQEFSDSIGIRGKDGGKPCKTDCEATRCYPQIDHAVVRLPPMDHEFTAIAIIGDEDALFGVSPRQHVTIGKIGWIIRADARDIVAERAAIGDEASF